MIFAQYYEGNVVEALTLQQFTDRSNNLSRSLGSLELILFSNPLNLRVTDEAPPLYYNIQSWYIVYLAFKEHFCTMLLIYNLKH
jgi:hypothetical protein